MNYCPKCKILYSDDTAVCECNTPVQKKDNISPDDEILLTECKGVEKDVITATLSKNMVVYREARKKGQKYIAEMQKESVIVYNIYVPYSDFNNAKKALEGINRDSISNDTENNKEDTTKQKKDNTEYKPETFKEVKHATLWKVVSALLFLALVALVVFATDFVIGLFKN